jgi:KDO2-lipid IV(A) lauroyltransferase
MQRARRATPYDRLIALALRAWLSGTGRLSLRAAQRLGRVVGDLAYWVGGSPKRITRTNLSVCFPGLVERELRALTRASLRQTGCYAAELGIAWRRGDRRWEGMIAGVRGEVVIDEARSNGRAVLLLAPHFGNWEFANLYLGARLPLQVLYESLPVPDIDPLAAAGRARTGSRVAPLNVRGLRDLYRVLARGEVAALMPDQVPSRRSGEYAKFFGREALTMTLAHRLIEKFRPCVVLVYVKRLPEADGFEITFERLLDVERARDSIESLTAMNAAIERVIELDPAQYQWEYRRFRRPRNPSEKIY